MANICFYISDYGYGHASRDIAIIRKIINESIDVKIYIKTNQTFHFVQQSLPQKNVKVIQTKNDIGVVFKENSVIVDRDETKKILDRWIDSWDEYIQNEKMFCKKHKINLIISDIVPQAFIIAKKLNIYSIAISNFTWHYIFYNLFEDTSANRQIEEAYNHANLLLSLPFNEKMQVFKNKKEISLVSRKITVDKKEIRKKHNIKDNELLVYIGMGKSFNPSFLNNMKQIDVPNIKFLTSSNTKLPFKNVIKIPNNETETQNYIAACDLIVSKTGYGTASEGIRAKVPMIFLKRDGFKEDELIGNKVKELGIGQFISEKSFLNGNWLNELNHLESYTKRFNNLNNRFKNNGILDIVNTIKEII